MESNRKSDGHKLAEQVRVSQVFAGICVVLGLLLAGTLWELSQVTQEYNRYANNFRKQNDLVVTQAQVIKSLNEDTRLPSVARNASASPKKLQQAFDEGTLSTVPPIATSP